MNIIFYSPEYDLFLHYHILHMDSTCEEFIQALFLVHITTWLAFAAI